MSEKNVEDENLLPMGEGEILEMEVNKKNFET